MAKIQLAFHRINNVLKKENDLNATTILKKAAKEAGEINAIKSNSGNIIPCKCNKNGTVKKGYLKAYETFKNAEMSMGYCIFSFISVKGASF